MIVLDVAHVFRVFGGPKGVMNLLEKHQQGKNGEELKYNKIQMWQQRHQIPTKWIVAVIYCIEMEGHQCVEFFTDIDEFTEPPPRARPRH